MPILPQPATRVYSHPVSWATESHKRSATWSIEHAQESHEITGEFLPEMYPLKSQNWF